MCARPATSAASVNEMILLSRHAGDNAEKTFFENTVTRLAAQRDSVLVVPHVYHLAEDDALWAKLGQADEPLLFLSWLHPRPAEWLLRRHGLGEAGLAALHLGAYKTPEQCLDACAPRLATNARPGTVRELSAPTRDRWYPVVDYSRCVNCKQCLQFCLFGVYETSEGGKVSVAKPDHCKPGCPACSRICPRGAIMFPLYEKDPSIAGAPGRPFPSPDEAARKAFEQRTKTPYRSIADDDLDALVDDLDRLTRGKP